jgi:ParB-like chromosome segregation protein Spo0J
MVPELKVNPEYEALLPKLPAEEYEALKRSIRMEGLHYPIAVNQDYVILDGHHRYRACRELGIEPKVEVEAFDNPLLEKRFVIESNLLRRHLTTFQKIEMAKPLLEIERELARQRQQKAGELFGRGKLGQNFAEPISEGKALEVFEAALGD